MIDDIEIKKIINAQSTDAGIRISWENGTWWLTLSPYHAYRFSVFLDRAILDHKARTGKTIDEDFAG